MQKGTIAKRNYMFEASRVWSHLCVNYFGFYYAEEVIKSKMLWT